MSVKRLRISGFRGLDTRRGDYGADISASPDAVNFVCRDGMMQTAGGTTSYAPDLPENGARLFQAFFRDSTAANDRRTLMAAGGGKLYALTTAGTWKQLGTGYASDDWRAVNYRSGESERILLTNGVDGLIGWDGDADHAQPIRITQGGEEIIFSQITLLYERLWGAVHADAPDRVYWSESFAPDDWEISYDLPETGGGFADVATFDGSRIRAIVAAFDDVLIFKDKSMHRLNGSYPGEFSLTQVYGAEGTLAARSIVHTADRLYFLGTDGLCVYNGMSVSSLSHTGDGRLDGLWKRLNRAAIGAACATIFGDTLYLALPLDGAAANSHVLQYRLSDGVCSLTALPGVRDWLIVREEVGERLVCLIGRQILEYGVGSALAGQPIRASWISPVISMGTLAAKRTIGRICFVAEGEAAGDAVGLRLTLMSGEKERSKDIPLKPGANLIRQRLRIRGRTFRFRIENLGGCRLTISDGLEIVLEEDADQ